MAKITYIEHSGTRHEIDVARALTVMESARENGVPDRGRLRWRLPCSNTCHVYVESALGEASAAKGIDG